MPLDQPQTEAISNDVISDFMRQYRQQKRKCSEEQGVLRNILKRAKSAGLNTKEMTASVQDLTQEPDIVAQNLSDGLRYRTLLGIKTITREALFDWSDDVSPQTRHHDDLWDAEENGYKAGRAGQSADDNPYDVGSELHVHWLGEYRKGQMSIAREMGPNVKQANPSRGRPRRDNGGESGPRLLESPKTPKPSRAPKGTTGRAPRVKRGASDEAYSSTH